MADDVPAPTFVDDPELTELLDTYAALNRERAERAKGELRAGIAIMRAELAAPRAPRAASLSHEQSYPLPMFVQISPWQLRGYLDEARRKIQNYLQIYAVGDLVALSPGARRHIAVLFEATDPKHAARAIEARRNNASSRITDVLHEWTVVHSRAFEPREHEPAVDSAREAAEGLLHSKIYSCDDVPTAVYAAVSIATNVDAIRVGGGGWQSYSYERREAGSWGGASICAAVDFPAGARAYWALALPEIVWGCAFPEALGPLACVTIPFPVTAGAGDDERVNQDGPRRGAVRALRFLLAASVDGKDTLMHAIATALRTESEIWRAQLDLNRHDTYDMTRQLSASATATSSTASLCNADGYSRLWSSQVKLLDTDEAWRQLGNELVG